MKKANQQPLNGGRFSRTDLKRLKGRLFPSASGGSRARSVKPRRFKLRVNFA